MSNFNRFFLSVIAISLVIILSIAFYAPKPYVKQNSTLLVVLGAGFFPNGQPVPALEKRLNKSVSLWNKNTKILISGRQEEVEVMSDYLQNQGIKSQNIIYDTVGINTRATVVNAYKIANKNNTIPTFISQAYHLPRIRMYSSFYGDTKANFVPTTRVQMPFNEIFYVALREFGAIVVFPLLLLQEEVIASSSSILVKSNASSIK